MTPQELLFYLVAISLAIFIYQFLKRRTDLPPGPWNLPILGYLPWLDPKEPHVSLTIVARKFGPICGLYMGTVYTVLVSDFKLLKDLFRKEELSGRPKLFLFSHISNFQGILLSEGELWKNQRKLCQTFLKRRGASNIGANKNKLQEDITYQILDFIKNVEDKSQEGPLTVSDILIHNVASLGSLILLNFTYPRDDPTWNKILHGINEIPHLISLGGPLNFLPFFRLLPSFRKQVEELKVAVGRLLDTFKILIHQQSQSSTDVVDSKSNLVEAFLEEKSKHENSDFRRFYTEEQLTYLISDMFIASVESQVTVLSWCFLFLAVHQKVQDKVREELLNRLQGEQPSFQNLSGLHYLEATITEVTRIRTVTPIAIPHCALSNVSVGSYTIPKGTMVVPLTYAIHMDPVLWGDPETFRPERFLNETGMCVKPEYFIPFGIGKRICVGEDFSKRVVMPFVAYTVHRFRIDCVGQPDLTGDCGLTVVPKPHKLRFTKL